MNMGELKAAIAGKTELSQINADKVVKALLETITETLQGGGTVNMTGFGSFSVAKRAARMGRNPQTGAEIKIPAANTIRFRVGKNLRDAVNVKPAPKAKKKKK